jgi:hypothetical protein
LEPDLDDTSEGKRQMILQNTRRYSSLIDQSETCLFLHLFSELINQSLE